MKTVSEYDYIYEDFEGSGFKFEYKHNRIGSAELVPKEFLDSVGPGKDNQDPVPIVIHCCKCNQYMNYISTKFRWQCPVCKKSVYEDTALRHIDNDVDGGETFYDEEDEWY